MKELQKILKSDDEIKQKNSELQVEIIELHSHERAVHNRILSLKTEEEKVKSDENSYRTIHEKIESEKRMAKMKIETCQKMCTMYQQQLQNGNDKLRILQKQLATLKVNTKK